MATARLAPADDSIPSRCARILLFFSTGTARHDSRAYSPAGLRRSVRLRPIPHGVHRVFVQRRTVHEVLVEQRERARHRALHRALHASLPECQVSLRRGLSCISSTRLARHAAWPSCCPYIRCPLSTACTVIIHIIGKPVIYYIFVTAFLIP